LGGSDGMMQVTLGKSRVRETRTPGSVRAKAKWLSYSTNHWRASGQRLRHGFDRGQVRRNQRSFHTALRHEFSNFPKLQARIDQSRYRPDPGQGKQGYDMVQTAWQHGRKSIAWPYAKREQARSQRLDFNDKFAIAETSVTGIVDQGRMIRQARRRMPQ
jgi:hypothetical protein